MNMKEGENKILLEDCVFVPMKKETLEFLKKRINSQISLVEVCTEGNKQLEEFTSKLDEILFFLEQAIDHGEYKKEIENLIKKEIETDKENNTTFDNYECAILLGLCELTIKRGEVEVRVSKNKENVSVLEKISNLHKKLEKCLKEISIKESYDKNIH